jgi:vacuolar-type H+-ATPase subunit I/STV1
MDVKEYINKITEQEIEEVKKKLNSVSNTLQQVLVVKNFLRQTDAPSGIYIIDGYIFKYDRKKGKCRMVTKGIYNAIWHGIIDLDRKSITNVVFGNSGFAVDIQIQ